MMSHDINIKVVTNLQYRKCLKNKIYISFVYVTTQLDVVYQWNLCSEACCCHWYLGDINSIITDNVRDSGFFVHVCLCAFMSYN